MPEPKPILVYQMGKVGSRSAVKAIEERTDRPIFHIHQLDPEILAGVAKQNVDAGNDIPPHIEAGRIVNETIVGPGRPADVVTLVREPIGRNISAFFQNLNIFVPKANATPQEMVDAFVERYPHSQPATWFQREIGKSLGIDVFATPFDIARGWQVYERGPYRMLLMRCESPDETKAEAIADFFGWSGVEVKRVNMGDNKKYKKQYLAFKDLARFPSSFVDKLLDTEYARHFYTEDERTRFRTKWTAAADTPQTAVS